MVLARFTQRAQGDEDADHAATPRCARDNCCDECDSEGRAMLSQIHSQLSEVDGGSDVGIA